MRIEKVNENQIRCVLSREDLEARHIKLTELAYGSEKAKELFHEMVKEANEKFDFDVEDSPLMVEAIPSPADSLVLLISKVDYPDELDPRFSRFSDPGEEYFEQSGMSAEKPEPLKGASDILDLFKEMKEEEDKKKEGKEEKEESGKKVQEKKPVKKNLVRSFSFTSLEQVQKLSGVLKDYYHGSNSLYRKGKERTYYLFLHKSDHTPEEYNRICNIAAEFGKAENYEENALAYFEEHSQRIIADRAVQTLALL